MQFIVFVTDSFIDLTMSVFSCSLLSMCFNTGLALKHVTKISRFFKGAQWFLKRFSFYIIDILTLHNDAYLCRTTKLNTIELKLTSFYRIIWEILFVNRIDVIPLSFIIDVTSTFKMRLQMWSFRIFWSCHSKWFRSLSPRQK